MKFQLFLEMSGLGRRALIDFHRVIHSWEVSLNVWKKAMSKKLNVLIHRRKELCGCDHTKLLVISVTYLKSQPDIH